MRIDLLGAEFNIKTDENPEYLEEVVEVYRSKIQEVRATTGTSDPLKVAILAGILTADDYLKQTGAQRTNTAEASRITLGLITEIETVLAEESDCATLPPMDDTDSASGDQSV
ncbi:MAG: cell division protein ZapA [Spirochaetales bacterium]|nr:cell division protein ZapA [Spirochaetales bacterium]